MTLTKQQIIDAALKAGLIYDADGCEDNITKESTRFHRHSGIGFYEYALGDNIIEMLTNLGIEIEEVEI